MGSAFELGLLADQKEVAEDLLTLGVDEIKRIEQLLSEFRDDSITHQINRDAGLRPTILKAEVFHLLQRCWQISNLSEGAFDITIGPLKSIYQFKNKSFDFPASEVIQEKLQLVGFDLVELNPEKSTIFLTKKGMKLSFAAIGKGYAADKVKALWKAKGVQSGYINASGDLCAFGNQVNNLPWTVGIANPTHKDKILLNLKVSERAIATSGDYEQHFLYRGKRYSHSLNPKSGLPLSGIKSVSVISPSAELSDALATVIYTLGETSGIDFVNLLPQTHAIIINEEDEIHFSDQIEYETIS